MEYKVFSLCKGLNKHKEYAPTHSDIWIKDKLRHAFSNDEICISDSDVFYFLEGFVSNKSELASSDKWEDDYIKLVELDSFPQMLRGAFSGINIKSNMVSLFVDHVGQHALYYYAKNNIFIAATRYGEVVKLLKENGVTIQPDEQAVKYMLEVGFMLDDTTFCSDIKRVEPGCIVHIGMDGTIVKKRFYSIDNTHINNQMSENEAIVGIDYYFRQAVRREFDKDREYGYKHLVDLSGGLDSRMTCMVAHDMGYEEQLNFTYCRKGYLDYSIAEAIACDLKHQFLYMPLDYFKWFAEVEESTDLNNGAALYSGPSGANAFLKTINMSQFGIEHTGMIGDAILSTFYDDEEYNFGAPTGKENAYTNTVSFPIPTKVLGEYENREQFSVHTRGMLGAQSSYLVRQNYVECSSPFMDVDFLNFVFSIPHKIRRKHNIYIKWLNAKYPKAAEYGWEKWYGIKPTSFGRNVKKIYEAKNKVVNLFCRICNVVKKTSMVPDEYWLANNKEIAEYLDNYYAERISLIKEKISSNLVSTMMHQYENGTSIDKAQVLTCLAMLCK